MKKIWVLLFPICVLLCGCSTNSDTDTKKTSQTQSIETVSQTEATTAVSQTEATTAVSQAEAATTVSQAEATTTVSQTEATATISPTEATAAVNSPTEEELRQLIDENTYCNLNVFSGSLPLENKDYVFDENDAVQQVDTGVFGSYAEFEEYIRSVYCKKKADMLLYDYPYEGDPKYLNIDGDLYLNLLHSGAKGYYVDWTNYTVTINYTDETECRFTVKASAEYPGEATEPEDYITESKAVLENGKWLLSEMIY